MQFSHLRCVFHESIERFSIFHSFSLLYKLLNSQMHPKGQNFQHTTLLCTEFKRRFVLVCRHSVTTHHREPNAQDITQEHVLFYHHQLEVCVSTPLQSIFPSNTSSPFDLLQALALTTFYCSSGHHRCWFAPRPTASSICCCGHGPPPSDELRLP